MATAKQTLSLMLTTVLGSVRSFRNGALPERRLTNEIIELVIPRNVPDDIVLNRHWCSALMRKADKKKWYLNSEREKKPHY